MGGSEIRYSSIGVIHSPFRQMDGMPIQPCGGEGVAGTVEVARRYARGLKDLEGFSHIILLYHFHRAGNARLMVVPFLDSEPRGIFATRATRRPNPIGLSVVRLIGREGNLLRVENLDILDGTPLLDIKPYVPQFDSHKAERAGWLQNIGADKVRDRRSDSRFARRRGRLKARP